MFAEEYTKIVIEKDNILEKLKKLIELDNISFGDDYAKKYYYIWKNTLNLINSCMYLRGENIYAAYCLAASVVENILYILVIDDNPKERLEDFVNFSKIDMLIKEKSEQLKDKSFNKFRIGEDVDVYDKKSYYLYWYNIYNIGRIHKLHELIKNEHRKKVYQEYYNNYYRYLCTYKHLHFITLKIVDDNSNYITLTNFITDLLAFSLFNLACIIEKYSSEKNEKKIKELTDRYIKLYEKIKND